MDEYQNIIEQLKPRRLIAASDKLRHRVSEIAVANQRSTVKHQWLWEVGSAAACIAIVMGGILLFRNNTTGSNNDCVVYAEGKLVVGNSAKTIAEADVAKMEQFMQMVAQQNELEKEKVRQFMQHKTQKQ